MVAFCDYLFKAKLFRKKIIHKLEDAICDRQFSCQNILELQILLTESMTIITLSKLLFSPARADAGTEHPIRLLIFLNCSDTFQLNRNRSRQCIHLDRRAAGQVGSGGKELAVDAVVVRPVALHVRQEHRYIHDVLPARTGLGEDGPDVLEAGAHLRLDVPADELARGVELGAGDVLAAAFAGADAREEEEVAGAAGVGVGAEGFGGGV